MYQRQRVTDAILWASAIVAAAIIGAPALLTLALLTMILLPSLAAIAMLVTAPVRGAQAAPASGSCA